MCLLRLAGHGQPLLDVIDAMVTGVTAGRRVVAAREFFRHARTGPKPEALPRAVAGRDDAELRKLPGQVRDYIHGRPGGLLCDGRREDRGHQGPDEPGSGGGWRVITPGQRVAAEAGVLAGGRRGDAGTG